LPLAGHGVTQNLVPALLALDGEYSGQQIVLEDYDVTVGRSPSNLLVLTDDEMVSGSHCHFVLDDGQWVVEDLDSTNGTLLNNAPVTRSALIDQDVITIGNSKFRYVEKTGKTSLIAKVGPTDSSKGLRTTQAIEAAEGMTAAVPLPPAPLSPAAPLASQPPSAAPEGTKPLVPQPEPKDSAPPPPPKAPAQSKAKSAAPPSDASYFDEIVRAGFADEDDIEEEEEEKEVLNDWLKTPSSGNTILAMAAIGLLFLVMLIFFGRVV